MDNRRAPGYFIYFFSDRMSVGHRDSRRTRPRTGSAGCAQTPVRVHPGRGAAGGRPWPFAVRQKNTAPSDRAEGVEMDATVLRRRLLHTKNERLNTRVTYPIIRSETCLVF